MTIQTVGLPPERFDQLKTLAAIDGLTMSDVVSDFLDQAIQAGRLPDRLPGWTVERTGEHVVLACPEAGLHRKFTRAQAIEVAEQIGKITNPVGRARGFMSGDFWFSIVRKGSGIILTDCETDTRRTVAVNVAADIARRLHGASR